MPKYKLKISEAEHKNFMKSLNEKVWDSIPKELSQHIDELKINDLEICFSLSFTLFTVFDVEAA